MPEPIDTDKGRAAAVKGAGVCYSALSANRYLSSYCINIPQNSLITSLSGLPMTDVGVSPRLWGKQDDAIGNMLVTTTY